MCFPQPSTQIQDRKFSNVNSVNNLIQCGHLQCQTSYPSHIKQLEFISFLQILHSSQKIYCHNIQEKRTDHVYGRREVQDAVARGSGDRETMVSGSKEGNVGCGATQESTFSAQGSSENSELTNMSKAEVQKGGVIHEMGKFSPTKKPAVSSHPILGNDSQKEHDNRGVGREEMHWETDSKGAVPEFDFNMGPNEEAITEAKKVEMQEKDGGPTAMSYSQELGWTAEKLGPTSGHWKRKARENRTKKVSDQRSPLEEEKLNPRKCKRESSTPLSELDPKALDGKRNKVSQSCNGKGKENSVTDGGEVAAAAQRC